MNAKSARAAPRPPSFSFSSPCCSTCWRSASSFRCCRSSSSISSAAMPNSGRRLFGLFGTAWALMQFLFSPMQGALSDRFGRRAGDPDLQFRRRPRLRADGAGADAWWLFVGRRDFRHHGREHLDRLCLRRRRDAAGQRAARFGLLGRRFRRGLRARAGARRARRQHFAAAAVLDRRGLEPCQRLLRTCWSCRNRCRAHGARRSLGGSANPFGALVLLRSHAGLLGLAMVNFLDSLAHAVLPSIAVLYMMYRYGWDERIVGLTMAGVGVRRSIVQGVVVGAVTQAVRRACRADDRTCVWRRWASLCLHLAQTGADSGSAFR